MASARTQNKSKSGEDSSTFEGTLAQAEWPEPVERVQALAQSGINVVPPPYIKPPRDRPVTDDKAAPALSIPVIDLRGLELEGQNRQETLRQIFSACKNEGFFQVLNHGVPHDLMRRMMDVSRCFFSLPLEEKQVYANSPDSYEGYGSRLGVKKGALLDWGDYFFHHLLPVSVKNVNKWPTSVTDYKETMEEYGKHISKLCEKLLGILSINLGLEDGYLQEAFGGENVGMCVRINYYPTCPQPDLTLGLSSHSDPGGMTVLLPDYSVQGLQVFKEGKWILVETLPHALIVNIGDQLQILSNGIYKSVEHRVIVNSEKERVSIAVFYNPDGDKLIFPATPLVGQDSPALYKAMTFNEYRLFIRQRGPLGKTQVNTITKQATA